jgi:hypothetical protein
MQSMIIALGMAGASIFGSTSPTRTPPPAETPYVAHVDASKFHRDPWRLGKQGVTLPASRIRQLAPGTSKDLVYSLIGPPNFHEGITRTWNYLIFVYTGRGLDTVPCRMQLHFRGKLGFPVVDTITWQTKACAARVGAVS